MKTLKLGILVNDLEVNHVTQQFVGELVKREICREIVILTIGHLHPLQAFFQKLDRQYARKNS